ncbi:putative Chromo domain protein Chp1p [Aspergillus clavatus NRRL 1]|uniref:Chromo domain protein n=1 Tax=Aspergillus clavatus (strain ATCC 1007 / CBS 513.65 / DSM 816 / NCTC 3887 / NRRL 1 / QM 1276 / 107) TaxID=344612 RepID=A1CS69_ASPCL|nr:chromo domain protein [Aspergillus clavatus NRRL 1]EAW08490.1 chromo domain protein [Aspergillus clavatus NRRL 1]
MSDEDDISITSTAPSEQESEYEVETILTELEFDDGIKYLVKWANYPIERCTWEPADSFCADQTLIDWNKKKKAIAEGKRMEFDLDGFEKHLAALEDAREDRKRRRATKRRRLGLEEPQQSPSAAERPLIDIVLAPESSGYAAVSQKGPSADQVPQTPANARSTQPNHRLFPTKQPPPPVSFGTAPAPIRPRRMNSSETPKLFNLSTRWRYEKAKADEPPPDMNKLELFRPSDWPMRSGLTVAKIGPHKVNPPTLASEPNTVRLGPHSVSSPKQGDSGPARLGPHNVSSPNLTELGSSRLGSHDVSSPKQFDPSAARIGLHDVSSPRSLHPASEMLGSHNVSFLNGADETAGKLGEHDVGSPMDLDSEGDAQPQDGGSYASSSPQLRHSPRHESHRSSNLGLRPDIWRSAKQTSDDRSSTRIQGNNWRLDTQSSSRRIEPEDPVIRQLPSRTPGPKAIYTRRHNYFWNPGEIMVDMFYGPDKKEIGPARLCGLSQTSRAKLMTSKKAHRIEARFQHVCNMEEHDILCASVPSNQKYSTGWIEGFDDTEPSIYKIGEELCRNQLVAILYPAHRKQNTILAYSPGSDFAFLDGKMRTPAGVFLHVAVRNELPSFDVITARREEERTQAESRKLESLTRPVRQNAPNLDHPSSTNIEGDRSHPTHIPLISEATSLVRERSKLQSQIPKGDSSNTKPTIIEKPAVPKESLVQSYSLEVQGTTHPSPQGLNNRERVPPVLDPMTQESETHVSSHELENAQLVDEPFLVQPQTHLASEREVSLISAHDTGLTESNTKAENSRPQLSEGPVDLDLFFKEKLGITYDVLATVNGQVKALPTDVFYLMFPLGSEIVQSECKLLEAFLKQHNALTYSSYHPNDWERFARTLNTGIVLAHESFMDYHALPHFRDLTRKHFNFWSVSLTKPLQFASRPSHFQRLFPHGGVILITEDFMVREPDATLIILAWFRDWIKPKFPGNWKIMFRPDVLNWLLQQPEPKDPSKHGVWWAMYALIIQINSVGLEGMPRETLNGTSDEHSESVVISPPNIPLYGSRTEDDDPNIPKGLTQEYRNTDHLAEFFAGWALVHNHCYRRFVIATAMKPLPRWEAWEHLEVRYGAKDFLTRAFKIDYKSIWNKLRSAPEKADHVSDPKSPGQQQQNHTQHPQHPQHPAYTPRTPAAHGPPANAVDVSKVTGFSHTPSRLRYPEPYS